MSQSTDRMPRPDRMNWADRRFVAKHSGVSRALVVSIPLSAMLWATLAHAFGVI